MIGDVLRRQNKKLEAISHMEHARDQAATASQATHGHILQLLAYTYADTGRETEFAEKTRKRPAERRAKSRRIERCHL